MKARNKLPTLRFEALFILCLAAAASAATVTSIGFKSGTSSSEIDITSDSPITFDKQENTSDKQLVIDLKDAKLSKRAGRQMDTSSFNSKVLLVSPYEVGGGSNDSRVVVQLRDMVSSDVTQEGNVIRIRVPNAAGTAASETPVAAETNGPTDLPPASPDADLSSTSSETAPTPEASAGPEAQTGPQVGATTTTPGGAASQAAAVGIKDKLGKFIESRESRHFIGKPITLKVRDADLVDVFRLIGDTSGFNIVVGDDVKGKVTLSLEDVPWDQALDVILTTQKLGAERNNNVLRIVTLADLTQEKQAELAAKEATEASAPRVTRVFPISYAKLTDLVKILSKFASSAAGASAPAGAGGTAAAAGAGVANASSAVIADPRTNSIIVRDTAANIARMQKLIELLDTQTPQVLIEAKVIEATEDFSNSLGGQLGFGTGTGNSQWFSSFAGADPIDPLFSVNGSSPTGNSIFTNGTSINPAGSTPGGNFALSPQLAFLPGNIRLNAILNLSEAESDIRIISSPKAVVLDQQTANIVESTPVLVQTTSLTSTGPVSTPTVQQANLSLNVTPTVTNEGSVLMQLAVSRDVPALVGSGSSATQAVANRNITTQVLVESGSTLVMGGIYTLDKESAASGFPILRKIPILGALFGTNSSLNNRTELFFFITPRILNLKESGITS